MPSPITLEAPVSTMRSSQTGKPIARVVFCIAAVFAVTAVLYAVPLSYRALTAALTYLFLVLIVSSLCGFRYAVFASFLTALGFSWLLPPVGVFWINDPHDVFALAAFLVIGIGVSHLSDRARREALNANQRRTEAVAAQQRFVDLVNSVEGIVWEADAQTFRFSFVSKQAERILGYPTEQWLNEPTFWKDHLHPEDRDWAVQFCLHATGENRSHDFQYRMIAADRRVVWIRDLVTVVVGNGRATRLRGVMVDVTERKRAEEELRAAETRFRTFVDHATDALFVHEEDGKIVDVNRQACESLGYTREELIGMVPHHFDEHVDAAFTAWVRKRLEAGEICTFETSHRRKDGTVFPVEVHMRPFWHGGRPFALALARDISDRKRAEEEHEKLRQLEEDLAHINRVSMMGELAASLGHEIKQPMAAAVTDAKTCLRWLMRDQPDLKEARDAASRMVEDTLRAVDIINRTSSLYKKGAPQRELVNVNEVVNDILALLRNEAIRYGISIRRELADDLPPIMADRVQLQQVLMNLMINSIDAMKGVDSTPELVITSQRDSKDQLLVSISDTGVGLPQEMGRIFDAFFTTKSHGTGMGLAISRSIIESHGGRLWAASNSGRGAIFYFTLPLL